MLPPSPIPLRRSCRLLLEVGGTGLPERDRLAAFGFSTAEGDCPVPQLAGPTDRECWNSPDPGLFRIETLWLSGAVDIEQAARDAYRELLRRVRGSAQPYLLRIWNFLDGINLGEGDAERYRAFCVGRAAAVDAAFHDPPPAATAIGLPAGAPAGLQVVALCGAEPGIALENPRQTPAWRYPREYGPVSPGFSRGAVLGQDSCAVLLASGTASIVGHVSQHVGDTAAQLEESIRNLEALLAEGEAQTLSRFSLERCQALRVYLRHAEQAPALQPALRRAFGDRVSIRILHGDICRRELDIELEGVFAAV